MKNCVSKTLLLSATSLLMTACAGGPFNGPEHAATVAETHPISVDSQVVTLTLDVDPSTNDVSDIDKARLKAFGNAYLNNGHGPLTVTSPSGSPSDYAPQGAASSIRTALNDAGIPWSVLNGATYRTSDPSANQVIVSYTHYVATASECGIWSGDRGRGYRNLRSANMGCATMSNYAAMIADPRDLIEPATSDPRDGASAVRAIELYREGEVTASEIDGNIETDISN